MGIDIAMAGDISEEALPLGEQPRPANLRLLGRVSDDDLAKLLRGAVAFLFPRAPRVSACRPSRR